MKKEVLKAIIFISLGAFLVKSLDNTSPKKLAEEIDFNQFKNPADALKYAQEKIKDTDGEDSKKIFQGITKQMHRIFKDKLKIDPEIGKTLKAIRGKYSKEPTIEKAETDNKVIFSLNSRLIKEDSLKVKVEDRSLIVTARILYVEKTKNGQREIENDYILEETIPSSVNNTKFKTLQDTLNGEYKFIFEKN